MGASAGLETFGGIDSPLNRVGWPRGFAFDASYDFMLNFSQSACGQSEARSCSQSVFFGAERLIRVGQSESVRHEIAFWGGAATALIVLDISIEPELYLEIPFANRG
jgi:hypothetical protein